MNTLSFVLATIATGIACCADRSFEITSVVAYEVGSANDPASPLRRWSIERISAPARLYILCEVRNSGDTVEDVFIVSHLDFVVAPTSQYGIRNLDSLQTEVAWGEQAGFDDVKLLRVPLLAPGEKRAVRLSGFDLKPLLKHYDGTADTAMAVVGTSACPCGKQDRYPPGVRPCHFRAHPTKGSDSKQSEAAR